MAIYDLKCNDCGEEFEKFVTGFLTDTDKECPECKSRDVKQVFSSFGIGGSSCSSGSGGASGGGYGGGCGGGSPFS